MRRALSSGPRCATAAVACVIALAGCTSSTAGGGTSSEAPSTTDTAVTTPVPSGSDSTGQSSTPAASSSAATSTSAKPSPRPSPKPTPTGPLACTNAHLKIEAIRGSAAAGQEFAVITFTNTGPAACTMIGFPGVSLRLHGAALGQPARRSRTVAKPVRLKSGQRAQAAITDYSSCQSAVSDTVRVYAPNERAFVDLPLALRGCRLIVDPVVPT